VRSMRALAVAGRGETPAVIDVAEPSPAPGEVRVSVEAASVNGFDLSVAAGRMWDAMPHEFPVVLGRDFVGTVDMLGAGVEGISVGDRVAGWIVGASLGAGALAEYVATPAATVTAVPAGVSTADAAAVGLAATAAYDAIDALQVTGRDTVLVAGATGGVGSVAVQLAAGTGAAVIATARPGEEADFVLALGARHVVDYSGDLVAAVRDAAPEGVSRALHAAGDPGATAATVRAGGRLASMLGATTDQVGRDDITVTAVVAHVTAEKLADLLAQVADSRLRVRVALSVPLEQAPEALGAFRGGTLGKVLVTR
jgi:NADPH:quinone reductase-like Zn-dependent oxidoreductase